MADLGFLRFVGRGADDVAGLSDELITELTRVVDLHYPTFTIDDLEDIARRTDISSELKGILGNQSNLVRFRAASVFDDAYRQLANSDLSNSELTTRFVDIIDDFRQSARISQSHVDALTQEATAFLNDRSRVLDDLVSSGRAVDEADARRIYSERMQERAAAEAAARNAEPEEAAEAAGRTAEPEEAAETAGRTAEPEEAAEAAGRTADAEGSTLYSNPAPSAWSSIRGGWSSFRRAFDNGPSMDGSRSAASIAYQQANDFLNKSTLGFWGWWARPLVQNFVVDPLRMLGRTPEYTHRLFSWRYADHKYTQGLFSAIDALKETNAARLSIAISNSNAFKQNVIFGSTDLGSSLRQVNAVVTETSTDLAQRVTDLSGAMRAASQDISDVATRLRGAADLSRQARNFQSQASQYSDFSRQFVTRSDVDFDGVLARLRSDHAAAGDATKDIFESAMQKMDDLSKNSGLSVADRQAEASRIIDEVATGLSERANDVTVAISEISSEAKATLRRHQDLLDSSEIGSSIQRISDAVRALDTDSAEIKRLVDSINAAPAEQDGLLTGGSVTARLAAHRAQEGLDDINAFSDELKATTQSLTDGLSTNRVNALFDRALQADDAGMITALDDLSDQLARRADDLDGVAENSFGNVEARIDAIQNSFNSMNSGVSGFTQKFAPEDEVWGAWRYFHTMGTGAGRVEADASDAHRALFSQMVRDGEITLPEGVRLEDVLNYRNGEDLYSIPRNTNSPLNIGKTTEQRFLENNMSNHNIQESLRNASIMLQRGDVDRYFESIKWAMLNYARDPNSGSAALGNREMQKFLGDFIAEMQGPRWYGSRTYDGGTSPFTPEIIEATRQLTARIEDLAPNEMRAYWADVWDRTRNLRYSGDYRSEVKFNVASAREKGMTDAEIAEKLLERRSATNWRDGVGSTGRYGSHWAFRLGNTLPWAIKNNLPFVTDFQNDAGKFSLRASRTFLFNTLKYTIPAAGLGIYALSGGGSSNAPVQTTNNTVVTPTPAAATNISTVQQAQAASAQTLNDLNTALAGGPQAIAALTGYGQELMDPTMGIQALKSYHDGILTARINNPNVSAADRAQYQQIQTQLQASYDSFMGPNGRFANDLTLIEQSIREHTLVEMQALDNQLRNVDANGTPLTTPPPTDAQAAQIVAQQQDLLRQMNEANARIIEARKQQVELVINQSYIEAIRTAQALPNAALPQDINVTLPNGVVVASNDAASDDAMRMVEYASIDTAADMQIVPVNAAGTQVQSLYEAIGLSSRSIDDANDVIAKGYATAQQDINSLGVLLAQVDRTATESDNPEQYAALRAQVHAFVSQQIVATEENRQNFLESSNSIIDYMGEKRASITEGMELSDANAIVIEQLTAHEALIRMHADYDSVLQANEAARQATIVAFLEALETGQPLPEVPATATATFESPDLSALSASNVNVAADATGDGAAVVTPAGAPGDQGTSDPVVTAPVPGAGTVTSPAAVTPAPAVVTPAAGNGGATQTAPTTPQWQIDLNEIKRQAGVEITNASNTAQAVSEDIANSTDAVDSLTDYVRQSNVILEQARVLQDELRNSTDGATTDRQQGIRNLDRMIDSIEENKSRIAALIPGLEESNEHIQRHLDRAQTLESEIRQLNGEGDVARARTLLTQLQGVKQEIADHAQRALNQYSTPAFEAYRENIRNSSGDPEDRDRHPGNREFNYRYGNDHRINRGIEALGGGRNSPLYDLFGTTRPGQSSYFGDVVGGVTSWFNRAGQQWRQSMLNAPDKSTANMYIWAETGAKFLLGLAAFNFINDNFLGGKVSGIFKAAVVIGIGLYFLRQSGELGDRWAARRGGGNPYAVGQGSGGNLIRTGGTGATPSGPRSGSDADPDSSRTAYNFPVRDRNGQPDNHVFMDTEGNITAQRHGGGNLVFGPRAEESIRDAVDTRIASTVDRLSGSGQHVPAIINGQVEVIFRHPGDQPGDAPRQSVLVDFSEDRDDALRIAQTVNAG